MPKKVLIAEDEIFLSKVLSQKLRNDGFEVSVASDGVDAITKIKSEKPDIVLLDLMMPQKDGFQVLREVRSDPEIKDTPVIVASNLGQKSDQEQVEAIGVQKYIIKSNLTIYQIVEEVKKCLE